ncbi:hypothetical protein CCR75_009607 [Bremia lactucae]|uniref:Uncharacterized protein n=1 Tax=Bremia lactucae TaxID=4779 RepID=A0A976FGH2_BRELC|nr:hypothetical protein CCR75_009607 [Bremia lactucae]
MAANEDNSCVAHAIQMAYELLGLDEASRHLPEIWREYVDQANLSGIDVSSGFKHVELIDRYCRYAVPKSGWSIHLPQLRQNLFDGDGVGYLAIARRVLPLPNVVLGPGAYIVGAYKKNMRRHCFAMQINQLGAVIIRENGANAGLGENRWFRTISFIRPIKVFLSE